ncbi:MAG: hypothetical protein AAF799_43810 [Myxococcota bacterium]
MICNHHRLTSSSTIASQVEDADWVVLGQLSPDPSGDSLPSGVIARLRIDAVLLGDRLDVGSTRVLVVGQEAVVAPDAPAFSGVLFLSRRLARSNDPEPPLPDEPRVEAVAPEPELASDSPDFGALRAHIDACIGLRRARLQVSMEALTGSTARLRTEAATGIVGLPGLASLADAETIEHLFAALKEADREDAARIEIGRALARIPAASERLPAAFAEVIASGVGDGTSLALARVLVDDPVEGAFELFERLTTAESNPLQAEGLAGLAALIDAELDGERARTTLAEVAARGSSDEIRRLANELVEATLPAST